MRSNALFCWVLLLLFAAWLIQAQGEENSRSTGASAVTDDSNARELPGEAPERRFKRTFNIALHGQVTPGPKQVVGSVITTDGLRAALLQREDVGEVSVFYPFHYERLFEQQWDVVVIEGWFLMIHDFIQIVRSHSPEATVLFYCLDPSFPGMQETLSYDVDGYLTNSRRVLQQLQAVAPSAYVPLAANPLLFRPAANPDPQQRRAGTVFVGAGGKMLEYKPQLLAMVEAALPFDLRLYGMGWRDMPQPHLRSANRGVLPRWGIAAVYASAQVVLGCTIEAQRREGMVNNRVFEAMASGAVLLTDHSAALEEAAEGTVLFANGAAEVATQLQWVQDNPQAAEEMGRRARALVLRKHTWGHRAVQILALANQVRALDGVKRRCCARPNCPTLAWVVSDGNAQHPDYTNVVHTHVYATFCRQYRVTEYSQQQFLQLPEELLAKYEAVLAVVTPFDPLHLYISQLELLHTRVLNKGYDSGFGRQQKWLAYVLGVDGRLAAAAGLSAELQLRAVDSLDLLMFRSHAEMSLFRLTYANSCHNGLRCEHLFGFDAALGLQGMPEPGAGDSAASRPPWYRTSKPEISDPSIEDMQDDEPAPSPLQRNSASALGVLVVCYFQHLDMCSVDARRALIGGVGDDEYHLLLVGGEWDAWVAVPGIVVVSDPSEGGERGQSRSNIQRVVHVPAGSAAWMAHSLFSAAEVVYFMHGTGDADGMSTTSDVTWPLLLAAQIGAIGPADAPASAIKAPTIRLAAHNHLLIMLARDNVRHWDGSYLDQCSSRAVCKVHGLGSGATSFAVQPLGKLSWEVRDALPAAAVGSLHLVMRVAPHNFMLGRDGDCCFHISWPGAPPLSDYNMSADSDLARYQRDHAVGKTCLLRLDGPVLVLQVDLFAGDSIFDHVARWDGSASCTQGAGGTGTARCGEEGAAVPAAQLQRLLLESSLDVTLRGNVFADPLRGQRIPLKSFYEARDVPSLSEVDAQRTFLNATV